MIDVIQDQTHPLLEQMFKMRARIFGKRLGWKVTIIGGCEVDDLDVMHKPIYLMYAEEPSHLLASCRLLPTTGPTTHNVYFKEKFHESNITSSETWECSKFVVDESVIDAGIEAIKDVVSIMMVGIARVCWHNNVKAVTGIVSKKVLQLYTNLGLNVDVLEQTMIDGEEVYLIIQPLDPELITDLVNRFGDEILKKATLQWR